MYTKKLKKIFIVSSIAASAIPLVAINGIYTVNSPNTIITNNIKIQNINLETAFVTNSDANSKTYTINFGVNRLEVFTKLNQKQTDLIKNFIHNNIDQNLPVKYDEFTGVLSIAYLKNTNHEKLNNLLISFLDKHNIEYRNIYKFNTNTQYEDFQINKQNENFMESQSYYPGGRYNFNNFKYEQQNEKLFSFVGLDQSTRQKHFYNYIDRKVNIGVLEYEGVAEVHSKAFEWNQKYGNGISWRNEPFYYEKWSRHATQVSELIAGKKGINQTAGIVSVEVNLYWNGLSGEFNYLLQHTNIVNNSWNIWKEFTLFLSFLPGYLDTLIFENPELINVISAGNQYNKNSKEIFGLTLSKNSIIVGATSDANLEQKSNYSQIGNNSNYISVVAPGGEYTFTDESIHDGKKTGYQNRGTSFSAPVVTAIAGMLKQKYPHKFDLGSDSIIFKSALITGSRKPAGVNSIYTDETGYGIPQYNKIEEAMQSLIVIKNVNKNNPPYLNSRRVYFKKGDKIRASLAFLHNRLGDKTDIDFKIKSQSGYQLAISNFGNRNIEVIEFTAPSDGYYILEAYPYKMEQQNVEVAITYVKQN